MRIYFSFALPSAELYGLSREEFTGNLKITKLHNSKQTDLHLGSVAIQIQIAD